MKIRSGFVSNSSSSCFVVALSEVPKTQEELQKLFFGDEETYPHPYPSGTDSTYTCEKIAEALWNDLKDPITPNGVREAVASGYIEGSPEIDWNSPEKKKDRDAYWKNLRAKQDAYAHKQADQFMADHPDCVFLEFEYGDDTHIGCAMEHGTLFDKVPSFRISHH